MLKKYSHIKQFRNVIENFQLIGNECWKELESIIYFGHLEKNEYFSRENQPLTEIGFICEGILRIFYLDKNGNEWNKTFLLKNNFIAASINPEKKSITNIQALTPVKLLLFQYHDFVKLSEKYENLKLFIQKLSFNYLEQKQEREISLISNSAGKNYLDFLEKFPGLEKQIPHYHIAGYLGITPIQLSRIRKKIKSVSR